MLLLFQLMARLEPVENAAAMNQGWAWARGEKPDLALSVKAMPGSAPRIAKVTLDGQSLWLKDFDQPSPSKWHSLQQAAFVVTRLELLRPVPSLAGVEGCEHEIEAMRRFREAGARVPEIVWRRGASIAITDIGETLRAIEARRGQGAFERAAIAAAAELSRLHSHGLTHGRPILRNMTWDGASIGFIDFEEQPLSVMSREAAQARDIFLLLASLGRRSSKELVRAAFAAYAAAMPPGVEQELRRVTRFAPKLTGRFGRHLHRFGSRDLTGLTLALSAVSEQI